MAWFANVLSARIHLGEVKQHARWIPDMEYPRIAFIGDPFTYASTVEERRFGENDFDVLVPRINVLDRDVQHSVVTPFLVVVLLQIESVSCEFEDSQVVGIVCHAPAQCHVEISGNIEVFRTNKWPNVAH